MPTTQTDLPVSWIKLNIDQLKIKPLTVFIISMLAIIGLHISFDWLLQSKPIDLDINGEQNEWKFKDSVDLCLRKEET